MNLKQQWTILKEHLLVIAAIATVMMAGIVIMNLMLSPTKSDVSDLNAKTDGLETAVNNNTATLASIEGKIDAFLLLQIGHTRAEIQPAD